MANSPMKANVCHFIFTSHPYPNEFLLSSKVFIIFQMAATEHAMVESLAKIGSSGSW